MRTVDNPEGHTLVQSEVDVALHERLETLLWNFGLFEIHIGHHVHQTVDVLHLILELVVCRGLAGARHLVNHHPRVSLHKPFRSGEEDECRRATAPPISHRVHRYGEGLDVVHHGKSGVGVPTRAMDVEDHVLKPRAFHFSEKDVEFHGGLFSHFPEKVNLVSNCSDCIVTVRHLYIYAARVYTTGPLLHPPFP